MIFSGIHRHSSQHSFQLRVQLIEAVRRANLRSEARARAESQEGGHHPPVLIRGAVARAAREASVAGETTGAVLLHLHGANRVRVAARVQRQGGIAGVHPAAAAAAAGRTREEADQAGGQEITVEI